MARARLRARATERTAIRRGMVSREGGRGQGAAMTLDALRRHGMEHGMEHGRLSCLHVPMTREGSQEAVQVYAHEDADAPGIQVIFVFPVLRASATRVGVLDSTHLYPTVDILVPTGSVSIYAYCVACLSVLVCSYASVAAIQRSLLTGRAALKLLRPYARILSYPFFRCYASVPSSCPPCCLSPCVLVASFPLAGWARPGPAPLQNALTFAAFDQPRSHHSK